MTDYWAIASTALGTGIATAIFNQGFNWWREENKDNNSARYLAMRVAVILETFAIVCGDQIADSEIEDRFVNLPELPDFPDEESWKTLKPSLLEKALTLKHEHLLARSYIRFSYLLDGPEDDGEAKNQCGKCGYMAWELAALLRRSYGFNAFDPMRTSWDFVDTLKRRHDTVLAEAKRRNSN